MSLQLIQGHRGSSDNFPENTMMAIRKAIFEGAGAIEIDIDKTSDGEFVLMHDATVDRTTDGTGTTTALTWEYISGLDAGSWKDAKFTGKAECKVPKLVDVLSVAQYRDCFLQLHLKSTADADLKSVVDMVNAKNMIGQVLFSSSMAAINIIKAYDNRAFTINSDMPTLSTYKPYLNNAIIFHHEAVSIGVDTMENMLTMINDIHAWGKKAHVSYIDSNYSVNTQMLIDIGVDYILGNSPKYMLSVLKTNGITQIKPKKQILGLYY